jgi:hypothetical protein
MGVVIDPSSMPNFQIVIALRRSLAILTLDRPFAFKEESHMLTAGPLILAGVIPALSILAAVLLMFPAYPRETSLPNR